MGEDVDLLRKTESVYTEVPSGISRADRVCAKCDHAHWAGLELRCWANPPTPCMIGLEPAKIAGLPPLPKIVPVLPPTFPNFSCRLWTPMLPDHPDLKHAKAEASEPTHAAPERAQ